MNRRPGTPNLLFPMSWAHTFSMCSSGTSVAPMCWVMKPASRDMTVVPRM